MGHFFDGASGIVFDCDGTLLNTMDAWNRTEEALFAQAARTPTFDQMNEIRSAPIEVGARLFHEMLGVGPDEQYVLDFLDESLMGFYQNKARALPGVVEMLDLLKQAGIPCVVVTSSPRRYVEAGLACAGIGDGRFADIVTTDEAHLEKSDGRIYQLALDRMGAQVETAWGVDDALYAIRAMDAFGLRTVGAYECDETGTFEEIAQAATIAVHSLEELL